MERSLLAQVGGSASRGAVGREALEILVAEAQLAEALGLHGVWLLPAVDDDAGGYAAVAVQLWLAALASRTTRLRLGWGLPGLTPPARPPMREAEQVATLDVSSDGRLDVGLLPEGELRMEGEGSAADWAEGLRMLVGMWEVGRFSWSSPRFRVPPVDVRPKPIQQPHPPLWLIGWTDAHARAAGRVGLAYLDVSGASDRTLEQHCATYHGARADPVEVDAPGRARFAAAMDAGSDGRGMQRLAGWESMGIDEAVLHVGEPDGDLAADRIRRWASGEDRVH